MVMHHIYPHTTFGKRAEGYFSAYSQSYTTQFLSRVSTLTRHIDIAILSVCLFVRDVPVLDENGLTYIVIVFFYRTVAKSF